VPPIDRGRLNHGVCYRDETEHEAEYRRPAAASQPGQCQQWRAVSPDRRFAMPNSTDAPDAIAAMAISTETASAQESRTRMIKHPDAAPKRSTP